MEFSHINLKSSFRQTSINFPEPLSKVYANITKTSPGRKNKKFHDTEIEVSGDFLYFNVQIDAISAETGGNIPFSKVQIYPDVNSCSNMEKGLKYQLLAREATTDQNGNVTIYNLLNGKDYMI